MSSPAQLNQWLSSPNFDATIQSVPLEISDSSIGTYWMEEEQEGDKMFSMMMQTYVNCN